MTDYIGFVVTVLSLILAAIMLALGIRKTELSSGINTWLLVGEVALMVAGYIQLGVWGLLLAIVVLMAALAISSIRTYVAWEEHLAYAGIQAQLDTDQMKAFCKCLSKSDKAFALLGSVGTAELISLLCQRNRGLNDIRMMARPIALLWVVHRPELGMLVGKFDQMLRIYGHTPADAMDIADKITVGTRISAATFEEVLDAIISAALPTPSSNMDDSIAS